MLCELCQQREADKKNTHYLTDALIRRCLNEKGSNLRDRGMSFDISLRKPHVEFHFQRSTSNNGLTELLGREPTEAEIENAKKNLFSVNNVFCGQCETLFTSIEQDFINEVLPEFEKNISPDTRKVEFENSEVIRAFFLLQVFRNGICENIFKLESEFIAKLRHIILDWRKTTKEAKEIPLNIIYLNNDDAIRDSTQGFVGSGIIEKNLVIFLCDFVIQVFQIPEDIKYIGLYGLNNKKKFRYFCNHQEDRFLVRVVDNEGRRNFLKKYSKEKADETVKYYRELFRTCYFYTYYRFPEKKSTNRFIAEIIGGNDTGEAMRYSAERVQQIVGKHLAFSRIPF